MQVLAFLDTGSGKTFISVLLIRHRVSLVKQNPEDRRLAVFLAPKVALVMQVGRGRRRGGSGGAGREVTQRVAV